MKEKLMANIYPNQSRSIDPYSEYNSNVVSRLARMITRGNDSIHSPNAIDVIIDSTSPLDYLVITTGTFFKDDMIISIDENFRFDIKDPDFYTGTPWNEEGYYWIVAHYNYVKSKPAPQMSIRVFKPSQHNLLTESYLFLKAVHVIFNGVSFDIVSVHDYDPLEPTVGKRVYTQIYPGLENYIPTTFDASVDEGRFIYVRNKASLYFGTQNAFEAVDSVRDVIDTTSCDVGDVCYVASDGKAYPAIADSTSTIRTGVVLSVGLVSDGTGKVKLAGRVDNVPVENGFHISVGELVYLSGTQAGSVLNGIPVTPNEAQLIGRSLTDSTSRISIWLMPSLFNDAIIGLQGASGYSGSKGISGFSGLRGVSGFSGISGYSGYSGISGYSGYSGLGYSGVSGFSGQRGISGFSGAKPVDTTYAFMYYGSTAMNIASFGSSLVVFNTVLYDLGSVFHTNSFTAEADGIYNFSASVDYLIPTSGLSGTAIFKIDSDSGTVANEHIELQGAVSGYYTSNLSGDMQLTTGQSVYVSIDTAVTGAGGSIQLLNDSLRNFCGHKVPFSA
jgi:hypothetical protein